MLSVTAMGRVSKERAASGIANLDMRAETDYLIAYLALETDYHRHGNNHHRQPDSNTDSCYQHGRTGNLLSDIGTAVNTQRYETDKFISSIIYLLFRTSRIGFERFGKHKQCTDQILLLQDVSDAHFVAAGTRSGIKAGSREP